MGGSNLPRLRVFGAWAIVLGCWVGVPRAATAVEAAGVAGRVLADAHPVAEATVYAYQMVERSLRSALTDGSGEFRFADLPAGLYKIIAHKAGFSPAILVVTRRAAGDHQFVQVELPSTSAPGQPGAAETNGADSGYWELRSEVPADVLRELDGPPSVAIYALTESLPDLMPNFLTQVAAQTTVADLRPDSSAQLVAGEVGLQGRLGRMRLAVDGDFRSLASDGPAAHAAAPVEGEAAALRVRLEGPTSGRFDLATESERLLTGGVGGESPVGFERFQLHYHRDFGDEGSTAVLAQYLDETGLYADRRVHPLDLPRASRALRIEGNYSRPLSDEVRLRSGLRFRESVRDYATDSDLDFRDAIQARTFDAWSFADWSIDSTYVVQYGVFTTSRDGSVSVAPRGGMLVRLRPNWEASFSASRRFELTEPDEWLRGEFSPATLESTLGCADSEASCYEVQLLHGQGDGDHVRVGTSWREFDRTVRLFLEDDFFAGEGLFLVPGDRLPEVHANVRRRLGSNARRQLELELRRGRRWHLPGRQPAHLRERGALRFERARDDLRADLDRRLRRLPPGRAAAGRRRGGRHSVARRRRRASSRRLRGRGLAGPLGAVRRRHRLGGPGRIGAVARRHSVPIRPRRPRGAPPAGCTTGVAVRF